MTEQTTYVESYTCMGSQDEVAADPYEPHYSEMDLAELQDEMYFIHDERKKLVKKVHENGGIWTVEYERTYDIMTACLEKVEAEMAKRETIICAHCGLEEATLFDEYCADCYWDSEEDYKARKRAQQQQEQQEQQQQKQK